MKPPNEKQSLLHIQKVLKLAKDVSVSEGQFLFKEGDENHSFYIILQGEVEISKKTSEGQEKVIALLKTGDLLGEGVLTGVLIKPASARARKETQLLALSYEDFNTLLKEDVQAGIDFLMHVLETLNLRLQQVDTLLITLFEMSKIMDLYRDDLKSLGNAVMTRLLSVTKSKSGALFIKNPFSETYRAVYGADSGLSEAEVSDTHTLVIPLKDLGVIVLKRASSQSYYGDEDHRLVTLVAEQTATTIQNANQRASEKARNLLKQKRFTL